MASSPPPSNPQTSSPVVPLNAAAELFAALAENIRGSAVNWSPTALEKLENSLLERYGELLGGEPAIERLVALASGSEAA